MSCLSFSDLEAHAPTLRKHTLMTEYDSEQEELFHQRHPHLIQCADTFYHYTFYDADGSPFQAKPDFYHPTLECWIEFKCHQLNNKKTKQLADESHQKQINYKGRDCIKYQLDNGWNHSLFKQAKVQSSLKAMGKLMIVIFKDGTKLTTTSKNKMKQQGLEWIYESDLA